MAILVKNVSAVELVDILLEEWANKFSEGNVVLEICIGFQEAAKSLASELHRVWKDIFSSKHYYTSLAQPLETVLVDFAVHLPTSILHDEDVLKEIRSDIYRAWEEAIAVEGEAFLIGEHFSTYSLDGFEDPRGLLDTVTNIISVLKSSKGFVGNLAHPKEYFDEIRMSVPSEDKKRHIWQSDLSSNTLSLFFQAREGYSQNIERELLASTLQSNLNISLANNYDEFVQWIHRNLVDGESIGDEILTFFPLPIQPKSYVDSIPATEHFALPETKMPSVIINAYSTNFACISGFRITSEKEEEAPKTQKGLCLPYRAWTNSVFSVNLSLLYR